MPFWRMSAIGVLIVVISKVVALQGPAEQGENTDRAPDTAASKEVAPRVE